jgi:thioredoxin 1
MESIYNLEEFQSKINETDIVVAYYSNDACNVCKTLKPKLVELLNTEFPAVKTIYIDTEKSPVISGQYRVFSIPTIDIYVMGREHKRFSRNVHRGDIGLSPSA